jgi:hypothetical protein
MSAKEVKECRLCGGGLDLVMDFGEQCLAGQFPREDDVNPPRFPLMLMRCVGECGLLQLSHTVAAELQFQEYWYRSGLTATMRNHLNGIVNEAETRLIRAPDAVLDIGSNDGTLLSYVRQDVKCVGVDPAHIPIQLRQDENFLFSGTYPHEELTGWKFDLIFSIAMFYDAHDPLAFAKAVKANLAPDGLWCVEVADAELMLQTGRYDAVCHEHVCYYTWDTFDAVCKRAGLAIQASSKNSCNGGTLRFYVGHGEEGLPVLSLGKAGMAELCDSFVQKVAHTRDRLWRFLDRSMTLKQKVHWLGASTKANTVLQHCGIREYLVKMASDRDPRKHGRVTPGSRIPIVSEEESRAERPDIYLSVLGHFKEEVLAREKGFLEQGGRIQFPLEGE